MNDTSPLTNHCLRALVDKTYEKRKWAAGEIEKTVKKIKNTNELDDLNKIIDILSSLVFSTFVNNKKGGAIGLGSVGVALGQDLKGDFIEKIIRPILSLFEDQDSHVRYFASEALYNVLKIADQKYLPLFEDIFDKVVKLSSDSDLEIRHSVDVIDMLLKVTIESAGESFDVTNLIKLLRERILSKNLLVKQFIMSWIYFLKDRMLHVDMLVYFHDLLDGIFSILSEKNEELIKQSEDFLQYYLRKIKKNPSKVDFEKMINLLIVYTSSDFNEIVRFRALFCLEKFLTLSPKSFIPYSSGLLAAILVCFSSSKNIGSSKYSTYKINEDSIFCTDTYDIKQLAEKINEDLMKLVTKEQKKNKLSENKQDINNKNIVISSDNLNQNSFELSKIIKVLILNFKQETNSLTKIAILKWILYLEAEIPELLCLYKQDDLFALIVETFEDESEEVIKLNLQVLGKMVTSPIAEDKYNKNCNHIKYSSITNKLYFNKFINTFLVFLQTKNLSLDKKGTNIIRQMCDLISPEDIYLSISFNLYNNNMEINSKHIIIQVLNKILLTSSELFNLRMALRNDNNEKTFILFKELYKTWCISPIIALPLCYLSKNYKLAYKLVILFGEKGDITLEFLNEIDKLIQLIESPIFSYIRIELLKNKNYYLKKSLYGLMMLLPQSKAFHILRKRLQSLPNFNDEKINKKIRDPVEEYCDLKDLINIFEKSLLKNQTFKINKK